MFRMNVRCLFVAVALVAGACSLETVNFEDVKETAIYREVSLKYESGSGELSIRAKGKVGGSTGTMIRYPDESYIRVNGKDTDHRVTSVLLFDRSVDKDDKAEDGIGTFYSFKEHTEDPKPYTITWKNSDGTEDTYLVPIPTAVELKDGLDVSWEGAPIAGKEVLYVKIESQSQNGFHSNSRLVTEAAGLPVSVRGLLSIEAPYEAKVRFSRELRTTIPSQRAGGKPLNLFADYLSEEAKVMVDSAVNRIDIQK